MKAHNLLDDIEMEQGELAVRENRTVAIKKRQARSITETALVDIVELSPYHPRQVTFDPDQFAEDAELLESVRRFGVIEPVLLQPLPSSLGSPLRYRLVFGSRRVAAARAAGYETVPAMLAHSSETMDGLSLIENSGRRELTPYEKALFLLQLKEQTPGISVAELEASTGWPQSTIYSLLASYEKSAPTLRRLFAEDRLAPRTIQAMQPIFSQSPEEQHGELAQLLVGRTHAEVEIVCAAAQTGKEPLDLLRGIPIGRLTNKANPALEPTGKQEREDLSEEGTLSGNLSPSDPHLDPGNSELVREIGEVSGASRAVVTRLMNCAIATQQEYAVLLIACEYVGKGGKEEEALELSSQAFARRKVSGMLRREIRHLHSLRIAQRWVHEFPNLELQQFLTVIFGG